MHQTKTETETDCNCTEHKQFKPNIYNSIMSISNDITALPKNSENTTQGWKFRGIDDLYNTLHPLFVKHKVFITSKIINSSREQHITNNKILLWSMLDIEFTFHAIDGTHIRTVTRGEGMDWGSDKASNKSMSAALKYALMQMFLIPTEDIIDGDYDNPTITPKNTAQILPRTAAEATDFFQMFPPEVDVYTRGLSNKEKYDFCTLHNWAILDIIEYVQNQEVTNDSYK